MQHSALVYLLVRLPLALSMLFHGVVRMPKLAGFSQWMVGQFEGSLLPTTLVMPFSYALPFVELLIGLLLLVGLFTRPAAIAGNLVMLMLITGSALIEQWQNVAIQLFYAAYFAVLVGYEAYNRYSLDHLRSRTTRAA
ncbi:thiosulfate dehydrogenase [quinone] large subunit [Catalinimonas alkaloidigena]|uniref:Thiosulfate dehydrogenase [quinone] large subunit n=1 Tax=Catalinimonas alkaloidigena TaxID=1075417 RepID=A0A1G9HC24_9BACT|nr:DoxX family membrane protein [Catalinimonas alkaloidigena]SDL10264.1 thiosulfate dehydrogenase [quinone] large subunit [Catalinimonas alkaloidigena]